MQCKEGKKSFFRKCVSTTLKWGMDNKIPFFFTIYKFYSGHMQLLGQAYVDLHHSENYAALS